jgi:membrane protease YdiL (CAAX protease family)
MTATSRAPGWQRPLVVAALVTALVTVLAKLPESVSATAIGFAFLAVTYQLVLRGDDDARIRAYGLTLGGLLESEPLSAARIVRETSAAALRAIALAALVFPPFWLGFKWWWHVRVPMHPVGIMGTLNDALGQLLVIALPEEAFYRGYLQTALDEVWKPRWRVLGAEIGPGLFVMSAIFAIGHFCTELDPNRLGVFFPALLFGWLRARTRGVGTGIVFHALCNLFASYLGQSYGLSR